MREDTVIEYAGKSFTFRFSGGNFTATKSPENGYVLPKIMYVPAERNFSSVVDRPDKFKALPSSLYTFNDEYDKAKIHFANGLALPLNEVRFEYDALNKLAHIVDADQGYRLRLSEASSGFQSTVPLYLVTKYLSDSFAQESDPSISELSLEEQKKLEKEMKAILEDTQIAPDVRQTYLRQPSAKRKPACFINIVEEPEQNLFPASQQRILHALLQYANAIADNQLIMATHSPYLLNYLTLAVKAGQLVSRVTDKQTKADLNSIVPLEAVLHADDLAILEFDDKEGTIKKSGNYNGIPADGNFLNNLLDAGNLEYDALLAIEEAL